MHLSRDFHAPEQFNGDGVLKHFVAQTGLGLNPVSATFQFTWPQVCLFAYV